MGYGEAVDAPIYFEGLTEEHGLAVTPPDFKIGVGDRVAFYPNHVCTTVNLSNEIVGQRGGRVEVVWPVAARGART
jgi:D-serine deaminase-like pyridoxal phosphate-dependent protein